MRIVLSLVLAFLMLGCVDGNTPEGFAIMDADGGGEADGGTDGGDARQADAMPDAAPDAAPDANLTCGRVGQNCCKNPEGTQNFCDLGLFCGLINGSLVCYQP